MTPRRVVLVAGPRLAGVDGVVRALRGQVPEHEVVGVDEVEPERAPDAVVAVLSAAAPATRTDWELVERAAARTDVVIGVVSKIDAHRGWRRVLAADRILVAGWSAGRGPMPWVGVAAAPDLGEPSLDELVALLRARLATATPPRLPRRAPRPGPDAVEVRSACARTRLQLMRLVRNRCAALRTAWRAGASAVPVGGSGRFEALVRNQAHALLVELDDEITRAALTIVADVGADHDVRGERPAEAPDLTRPPPSSRRLEGRLMGVLGVGFGLGIAFASSRLLAGLAPGPPLVGLAAGAAVGLAVVVWVVRVRALLHDRALLERWVTEVAAAVRWHGEAMVAERLLATESACLGARSRRASDGVPDAPDDVPDHVTDQYEW